MILLLQIYYESINEYDGIINNSDIIYINWHEKSNNQLYMKGRT